jgi:hypothetical protein
MCVLCVFSFLSLILYQAFFLPIFCNHQLENNGLPILCILVMFLVCKTDTARRPHDIYNLKSTPSQLLFLLAKVAPHELPRTKQSNQKKVRPYYCSKELIKTQKNTGSTRFIEAQLRPVEQPDKEVRFECGSSGMCY